MYNVVKRTFDIIVSSILLLVLLPMLIFTAAVIKLSSPGPVFYCAPRAGLRGKPFLIIKFRTMKLGADKGSGTTALKDPRITKYGTFFRNYKIDELPQLINVLIGDMSLVGPRPELLEYVERYRGEEKIILNKDIPVPQSIFLCKINGLARMMQAKHLTIWCFLLKALCE